MYVDIVTIENSMEVSHILKIELPYKSAIIFWTLIWREQKHYLEKIYELLCSLQSHLQYIAKVCRQPKGPLINEGIKNIWHVSTLKYYSTIKNNKTLLFVTTRINLEGNVLSKSDKNYYYMLSLVYGA